MNNIKRIFDEAMQKYQAGEKKYGAYEPATDRRTFWKKRKMNVFIELFTITQTVDC
jgi:hypothetical protein